MVQGHSEDDQSWHGAVRDENHENGPVSGAIAGREQDQNTPAPCHGFLRGSGPDQQAHEQPEIVPGDMDQIALMDILPAPQPCPAQTTPVQDVRKRALDHFRPVVHLWSPCQRETPRRWGSAIRVFHGPPSRSVKTARAWYPLSATHSAGSSGEGGAPTLVRLRRAASKVPVMVVVSPSSAECTSAATTAPVSRSTACSGL